MNRRSIVRALALGAAACLIVAGGIALRAAEGQGIAALAALEGPIGPAAERHVDKAVAAAQARGAEVLILRIDTPGGLATSMREIIKTIVASPVPVVGYVAPSGAHAASAGTYILYATHVAAMAPGTNLGAATPVQIGGGLPGMPGPEDAADESPDGDTEGGGTTGDEAAPQRPADAMTAKATNDAVAFIRSLAEMRGRNADWAEKAVREAASLSAREARELNVVDLVAADVPALLRDIDGRTVAAGGGERALATAGASVERIERDFITRALGVLANPNVALILMMIGVYGLIFEFANPGSIGPGVIGVICLILGLYALNQLPLDYAGLALLALGIALMVAEAFTPTFGALGAGGLAAFVIGAAMLVETEQPAFQLSWWVIGGTGAASAGILTLALGYAWRAHRRPVRSGTELLVGAAATVIDWRDGEGHVWAEGERWSARGPVEPAPGETVRVEAIDGLTLIVGPAPAGLAPNPNHEET